jgi:hypothetical protein
MTDTASTRRPRGRAALIGVVFVASLLVSWLLDLSLGLAVNGIAPALRLDFAVIAAALAFVSPVWANARDRAAWLLRCSAACVGLAVPSLLLRGSGAMTFETAVPWLTVWAVTGLLTGALAWWSGAASER